MSQETDQSQEAPTFRCDVAVRGETGVIAEKEIGHGDTMVSPRG